LQDINRVDINRAVGERIRILRLKKGITQDQLAELTGLNRVHLYRLENGRQSMTLNTLKIIAETLEVRVRDLLGRV
jgi:transcriptional regulator with XRE-family HTH domain